MSTNYVSGNGRGAGDKVVTKIGMWSPVTESFQFGDDLGGHLLWSPGISVSLDAILSHQKPVEISLNDQLLQEYITGWTECSSF